MNLLVDFQKYMSNHHPCPICRNCQNNYVQDGRLQIFVCSVCAHVFSENKTASETIYNPEYYLSEHKNWFLHPNFKLFGAIEQYINNHFGIDNINILDIGCGKGDLLHFLKTRRPTWRLYGIDVTENKEQGITYTQGDFVNYEFSQKFDVVTGLMVIEHVPDPISFVKKLADILANRGYIFLVTINSRSIIYRLAGVLRRLGWRGPYDRLYHHHHLQHFNNASLRRLMEENGFMVLKQYSHNFPLSAIDVPPVSLPLALMYRWATAVLFAVSDIFGNGVNQTIICKKNI